jgi:two-component system sensor histidine kinase UhpB
VGPQATKLLGYPLEQWAEKDFWASHIHPEDRESAIRTCLESSERCKEFEFEYRMVSSEGQTVWVHDIVSVETLDGAPQTLRGFMVNITERKKAEESLRENEERTRLIVESALDAVITMDTRGLITGWNPQAETIFGWPWKDVIGRRMDGTIIPLRYREAHRRGLEHFLASNNGPMLNKRIELTALHRHGHEFPVELTVVPTRTGKTVSFNAFVRDITERKRAERELQERLRFEQLVSSISARFANVPTNEIDEAFSDGLRRLGEFFNADRSTIVEFSEDGRSIHSTYRWLAARLKSEASVPRAIIFSAVGDRWRRGEIVKFSRQEEIPENQRELRKAAKQGGFKSYLSVPLEVGGEFIGAVGITSVVSEREWSGEVVQRFKFIGELFANALTRKRAEEALQDLRARMINAQEEARRRLARELHDDVSQRLAVLAIEAGKLEQQSHYTPELIHGKLQGMRDQIVKLAGDIHRISRQLHPSILDDLGLVDAMESECHRFSDLEGIPVKFTGDRFPEGTPKDVSLCLYRVTQESLRNIAKHSKATGARVTLTGKNGGVFLSVEDSGVGFEPAKARVMPGLGLASMEERVRLINGSLSIHSAPGKGTVIEIQAPLA